MIEKIPLEQKPAPNPKKIFDSEKYELIKAKTFLSQSEN